MANFKKLLSFVLVLTMLLTMASFPVSAYEYTPKDVQLVAGQGEQARYGASVRYLKRPENTLYKGDTLSLAADTKFNSNFLATMKTAAGDDLGGFVLSWWNTASEHHPYWWTIVNNYTTGGGSKYVLVKVDPETGALTGFYKTVADMKAEIKCKINLDKVGKWGFTVKTVFKSTVLTADTISQSDFAEITSQDYHKVANGNNPNIWFIDVNEAPTSAPATAPDTPDGVAQASTDILASVKTTGDFVGTVVTNTVTETHAYVLKPGNATNALTSNIPDGNSDPLVSKKAQLGETYVVPFEGVRIDFDKAAYVDTVQLQVYSASEPVNKTQFDIFGSMDGENWYKIYTGGWTHRTGAGFFSFDVKTVAKFIRMDLVDHWHTNGSMNIKLTALTGVLDVANFGSSSSEESSSEVTSSDVTSSDVTSSDVTSSEVTSSATSSAASSSEATSSATSSMPEYTEPRTIALEWDDAAGRYKVPDGVQVYVGDTLTFDPNHTLKGTNGTDCKISDWRWYVHAVPFNSLQYMVYNAHNPTNIEDVALRNGEIRVMFKGNYYTQLNWGPSGAGNPSYLAAFSAELPPVTFEDGTSPDVTPDTTVPPADDYEGTQTITLKWDAEKQQFVVPEGTNVYVGDTLLFDANQIYTVDGVEMALKDAQVWGYYDKDGNSTLDKAFDSRFDNNSDLTECKVAKAFNSGSFVVTVAGVHEFDGYFFDAKNTFKQNVIKSFNVNKVPEGYTPPDLTIPEEGYAAREITMVWDADAQRYRVPAGVTVRVGDVLLFDINQTFVSDGKTYALSNGRLGVHIDVNGNGYIDGDGTEWNFKDSQGNRHEADTALAQGRILVQDEKLHSSQIRFVGSYSTWFEAFTVEGVGHDPELVAPHTNVILSRPVQDSLIGAGIEEVKLNYLVRMVGEKVPAFKFEGATIDSVDLIFQDVEEGTGTVLYSYYEITATAPTTEDYTEIVVSYGKPYQYRLEYGTPITLTRTKSTDLFDTEALAGENKFTTSATVLTHDGNNKYVQLTLALQDVVAESAVIDGVLYEDFSLEFVSVKSHGGRFADFTVENFKYNKLTNSYEYIGTVKRTGIDMFTAEVDLIGKNVETGEYVVIDTRFIDSNKIEINKPAPNKINWGRTPGKSEAGVDSLMTELQTKYGDESYVIVDCTDQNNELTWLHPDSAWGFSVSGKLWNALKDMNKEYIEFRFLDFTFNEAYTGKHGKLKHYTGNEYGTIEYRVRIYKNQTTQLDMIEDDWFMLGMVAGRYWTSDKRNVSMSDSLNSQIGKGLQAFPFRLAYAKPTKGTDIFYAMEFEIELPEEYLKRNGYDLKVYSFSRNNEEVSNVTVAYDNVKVQDRFDNFLKFDWTTSESTKFYAVVGDKGDVERPSTTNKWNVNTGAGDMAAVAAVFAVIGLGALALSKKRKED